MDAGSRSALIVPLKRGNKRLCGPRGGKRGIGSMDSLLGNTTDTWRFDVRIHETATDSRVGETIAADGVHFAGLSDGHRMADSGLLPDPQGRGSGRGRTDLVRLREKPGGQPPVAPGPGEVWHVPSTTGAARVHSEGGLGYRDPPYRNPDTGGQSTPAGG